MNSLYFIVRGSTYFLLTGLKQYRYSEIILDEWRRALAGRLAEAEQAVSRVVTAADPFHFTE